ncbi:MAG: discoidin domain-containing protein [Chloroflexi bacterium]|nr:discoidin domain-containing protein [Chloroflexota bacterium]
MVKLRRMVLLMSLLLAGLVPWDVAQVYAAATVPSSYRLPINGSATLTQGPGCGFSHGNSPEAIDIGGIALNRPIIATFFGTVVYRNEDSTYGKMIKLQHPDGNVSWYAHLNAYSVALGEVVAQGQEIGLAGTTGNSTGVHLHFEVHNSQGGWLSVRYLPGITWEVSAEAPCTAAEPDGWVNYTGSTRSNVAQGKNAVQSSTLAPQHGASVAVDGNPDGYGTITHTNYDVSAWWQVDLGRNFNITSIDLWNRTDCCAERLRKIYVFASSDPFPVTNLSLTDLLNRPNTVSWYRADPLSAQKISFNTNNTNMRYVRVQLGRTEYLSLAEVQVWSQPNARNNLAQGKNAVQSSTYHVLHGAGIAVDGNTSGYGSYTHTNYDVGAWWQVDLGANKTIDAIDLWNRTDCCAERLRKVYVFVSSDPFPSTNVSLSDLIARPNTTYSFVHDPLGVEQIALPLVGTPKGRYVRIQLGRTEYLSLAEVQVWSSAQ